jgi:opacity protein-like surface antigen
MKKLLIAITFLALATFANAQTKAFTWGVKVGIGTANLTGEAAPSSADSIKLGIKNARYGYYFGLFTQIKMGPVFFQPEVLFNSNRVDYTFKNLKDPKADSIKTEKYNFVDVPILIGFKLGPIRAKVGPVAHIHINSTSELSDVKGYNEKWKTALWGYQAGIGLNFTERLHLDIRYEGSFDKWGSHINIGTKNYVFQQGKPSRWLVNVGYAF